MWGTPALTFRGQHRLNSDFTVCSTYLRRPILNFVEDLKIIPSLVFLLCAVCCVYDTYALELYLQVCEKTLFCVLFVISVGGDRRNKVTTNSSHFYLSFSILCKFHFSSSHTATFLGIFLFDNLLSEMDLIVSQSMLCQLDFPVFLLSSESVFV